MTIKSLNGKLHRMEWLRNGHFVGADVQGEDMRGYDLTGAKLTRSCWTNCAFTGSYLNLSKGKDVVFKDCTFLGTKLLSVDWPGVHFQDCDLGEADLTGANLSDGSAQNCTWRGEKTGCAGTNFSRFRFIESLWAATERRGSCLLDGADLSGLRRITEWWDGMAAIVEHLGQATRDVFWEQLAALIRGVRRCGEHCWGYFLQFAKDKQIETLLQFAKEHYPKSGVAGRMRLELIKQDKVQRKDKEPLRVPLGRGHVVIADQFGHSDIIQAEGAESLVGNIDWIMEDLEREGD